jgi:hypothetical protein
MRKHMISIASVASVVLTAVAIIALVLSASADLIGPGF